MINISKKIENRCVGCRLPCIYNACPYYNVEVHYCDFCEDEGIEYIIDGIELCENCAEQYLQEIFDCMTIDERADILKVDYQKGF